MALDRNTVTKALEGFSLIENPALWEHSGQPTTEHHQAINLVLENPNEFHRIVLNELQRFPYTANFFGNLIRHRLVQDKPLSSEIIQILFPNGPIELEERLHRIAHIPNIETVSRNARPPKSFNQGFETDEVARDIWVEFFVADLLVSTFKADYVEKVVREKSQTTIEFIIRINNESWIVEVARLRRRDFQGETMPWGSRDCTKQENIDTIRRALRRKLSDKNEQIRIFVSEENCAFDQRVIAIKTSQEEYQDCSQIIAEEIKKLMNNNSFSEITRVMLIYDTKTYELIENIHTK